MDDYVHSASKLLSSVAEHGVLHPIPIDLSGELLDGSHRVASALALGLGVVPVSHKQRSVWAPPWNEAWFIGHDMDVNDLERLRSDWRRMRQ